jgi:hypothetical protein
MTNFGMAVMQHHENVDRAIRFLVDLHKDDVDISDERIFYQVLDKYNLLDDGFTAEEDYIIKEVSKRIR